MVWKEIEASRKIYLFPENMGNSYKTLEYLEEKNNKNNKKRCNSCVFVKTK